MSYDLVVFDPAEAPKTRAAFPEWDKAMEENARSDDPESLTRPLRAWFLAMVETFPPVNSSFLKRAEVDDPRATEYDLNRTAIHACFAWSLAEVAFDHVIRLAAQHEVGVWNVSGEQEIWLPNGRGGLKELYR